VFGEINQSNSYSVTQDTTPRPPKEERSPSDNRKSGRNGTHTQGDKRLQQIAEIILSAIYRYAQKNQKVSDKLSEALPDTITQDKTDA